MTPSTPFQELLKKEPLPTIGGLLRGMLSLDKPEDIRSFAKEYEQWLVANGDETIKGKEMQTLKNNLEYIIGYCGAEDRKKLYSALSDVSHPIFGSSFGRN